MTPEPTLRLFLALWPDDDTRAAVTGPNVSRATDPV